MPKPTCINCGKQVEDWFIRESAARFIDRDRPPARCVECFLSAMEKLLSSNDSEETKLYDATYVV